ncbi:hypothetical protein [Marisediminicola antarctica]|uniref:Uncharacterized protein n=1 Tax=Marisediminicola antarctica TaxID=674079 RepID=A0A7L5AIG1_9MICO|nr:hypothetical protein [Marisediminicola antarctica]QHO69856.1 hypothetical protein BHD05_09590 [Marisediminicola antarctica]
MTSGTWLQFVVLLVAFALFALGYAFSSRGAVEETSGAALVAALSSNERFHTFVAAPVWLIAASIATDRALTPQRLVRRGSRRALAFEPLWTLLARFAIAATVVSVVWLGVALTTMPAGVGGMDVAAVSVGVLAGAAALLAIGFATLYWVLLTVRLLSDSLQVSVVAAILIWSFSLLPNIGVFSVPHPLNFAQYVSLEYLRSRPSLFVSLLIAAVFAFVLCSAVAQWKDSGARRPYLEARSIALFLALLVGVLGAVAPLPGEPAAARALSTVFVGVGASMVDYLVGMTVILTLGIAATARFATDWTHRSALIRIRSRSTTRWVTASLTRELGWAARAVLTVAVTVVAFHFATFGGDPFASASEIAEEATLLVRLLVSVALVVILLILGVIVFNSEAAPAAISCGILVLGFFPPLWSPWNPLLAWSGQWMGEASAIAFVVLASTTIACFSALVIVVKSAHHSEVHHVHH